jgi:hypothetical protein
MTFMTQRSDHEQDTGDHQNMMREQRAIDFCFHAHDVLPVESRPAPRIFIPKLMHPDDEALTNIVRHSSSKTAFIQLQKNESG